MSRDKPLPLDPDDRRDVMIALGIVVLLILCLGLFGCATTDFCATCPERIVTVTAPPEVITVLPPVVEVPPMPVLESPAVAVTQPFDPVAWMRAVAGDVVRLLRALEDARAELEAVNASRPVDGSPAR